MTEDFMKQICYKIKYFAKATLKTKPVLAEKMLQIFFYFSERWSSLIVITLINQDWIMMSQKSSGCVSMGCLKYSLCVYNFVFLVRSSQEDGPGRKNNPPSYCSCAAVSC